MKRFPFPAAAAIALLALTVCKARSGGASEAGRPVLSDLEISRSDPRVAEAWTRLQSVRAADPGDPRVDELAEIVLTGDAPAGLKWGARLAQAQQRYAVGDDQSAIALCDEALSAAPADTDADPLAGLRQVRLQALVRGGDPARAVALLAELDAARVTPAEALGLEAIARDRNADPEGAVAAFARWRALLPDEHPDAYYAERRLAQLGPSLDARALTRLIEEAPVGPVQACLVRMLPTADRPPPASDAPEVPWSRHCGPQGEVVGLLLPRSGRLSALADIQLAAVQVAVPLLWGTSSAELLWQDAGSTPAEAEAGARALVERGARVIVGPVGPANVGAATRAVGSRATFILPGEAAPGSYGVAPSLEHRIDALVARGRELGARRFVVAAPDNAYGHRATRAIEREISASEARRAIVVHYPPSTTSFAPILAPLMPALGAGSALLVPDHAARVELLLRQLMRTRGEDESADLVVLTTGEGMSADTLGPGHEPLDGVWVAPAGVRSEAAHEFMVAFDEVEGHPADDQALLLYFALRRARTGRPGPSARTFQVLGGQIVSETPGTTTPR